MPHPDTHWQTTEAPHGRIRSSGAATTRLEPCDPNVAEAVASPDPPADPEAIVHRTELTLRLRR
jgi:hypothetical protein